MVKHKVTVKFGPYMSCGIVEHRTARLEGLQGKNDYGKACSGKKHLPKTFIPIPVNFHALFLIHG